MARAELQLPLGSGAKELGLRPSIYVDAGAVFGVNRPILQRIQANRAAVAAVPATGTTPAVAAVPGGPLYYFIDSAGALQSGLAAVNSDGSSRLPVYTFEERFFGDTWKPRVSIGIGVNWNSPFGPFRIDLARAILKQPGDDTKLFSFNVGTQF